MRAINLDIEISFAEFCTQFVATRLSNSYKNIQRVDQLNLVFIDALITRAEHRPEIWPIEIDQNGPVLELHTILIIYIGNN